ncbi:MAG TPA: NAD-dependent epimerase/dehydratase family protein [Methylomirabilota bacterium]|jgi:nucleoside-diphosphate-sugar epimerase|nr:NAD-dependent epimerase/dehydratase family protein [Methylomirabilota bacterium]
MKKILVCGAGGFIGHHLVKRLKSEGSFVIGVDLKYPEFNQTAADKFVIGDLRMPETWQKLECDGFDEMYQLAADMGGAGYLFSGKYDADILHNSAMINLYACEYAARWKMGKVFYASSACVYPVENQEDPNNPNCKEDSVYPAHPDSDYGFEKLFSERVYQAFSREYGIKAKIARFHGIFGPEGTYTGGKEKAPAAIARKVAEAPDGGTIEIWGDGKQTRSFLYVDQCVEAVMRLMASQDFDGPVNIGSEEMVSINQLAEITMEIAGKKLSIKHIEGPLGVRGRNSDNTLIRQKLGWAPDAPLKDGMKKTYDWVVNQLSSQKVKTAEGSKTAV